MHATVPGKPYLVHDCFVKNSIDRQDKAIGNGGHDLGHWLGTKIQHSANNGHLVLGQCINVAILINCSVERYQSLKTYKIRIFGLSWYFIKWTNLPCIKVSKALYLLSCRLYRGTLRGSSRE